jgi:capsular exopolysaccharide synthesis family protein
MQRAQDGAQTPPAAATPGPRPASILSSAPTAQPPAPAPAPAPRLSLVSDQAPEAALPAAPPAPPMEPGFPADDEAPLPEDSQPRLKLAMNKGVDDRLVAALEPSSLMAEEYRSIRTGMLARWKHRSHLVHTITSATPQEGKTITSLNLGLSFAELHNRRTIVIEADLRLPQFGKLLALPEGPGLVHVLNGECKVAQAIHEVGPHRLHVIPAGRRVGNEAVQILSGKEMIALLKQLRSQYDHVIIDTPPVVELADAGILGSMSDDVLLIVRLNRTPKPLIEQAIATLASYNAAVAGMIATDQQPHMRRYYQKYGYSYRYGSYANAKAA